MHNIWHNLEQCGQQYVPNIGDVKTQIVSMFWNPYLSEQQVAANYSLMIKPEGCFIGLMKQKSGV
jgi:hypothetical protein